MKKRQCSSLKTHQTTTISLRNLRHRNKPKSSQDTTECWSLQSPISEIKYKGLTENHQLMLGELPYRSGLNLLLDNLRGGG